RERPSCLPPFPERGEQPRPELRRQLLRLDRPRHPDHRPYLLDVVRAVRAACEMRVEGRVELGVHRALEIVGDHLDDLLTDQLVRLTHRSSSRYRSNAARTFARARWSSTR